MTLPCVEHETGPAPTHSILWLHGLGADGHDFAPIVPELVRVGWPAVRFVFPHAKVMPITLNGGVPMRAWYDIRGQDLTAREDEAGIRASIAEVEALIAREAERGIPAHNLVLAGFSQGGAIALAAGLRHAETLAGVVALSTYLPLQTSFAHERSAANAATPVFQAHGRMDPVVQPAWGSATRDVLRGAGYAVDWHDYPMAHAVCAEEIHDLADWLGARLG